ncbi:hypothetical protein D910_09616 [Dendroctonus ponderosae]|uniref:RRM domain-containing protein n=1 Tax=Dendroctonus ponderosae TaxID=77166 RepID=U4UE93_DENPD|nr:hypothetical protein D910_09616 [Dendroctonus ponderosae]KAH1007555.1 hypothetical protein HUJ04_004775 [Dendroctonus ponderosae]KAH1015062.1 hypothetical protein HUJ05_012844 [Dendroctonus ponderosae]
MAENDELDSGNPLIGEDQLDSFDETNGAHDESLLNDADMDVKDDPELEAIKARVREMEEEAEKLKQLQSEVDKQMNLGSPPGITSPLNMSIEEKMEVDNRSIYVGNVDYGATAEELEQHFHGCGSINRVTILCNRFDGHPKGFAYIEFGDRDSVQTAMAMDESLLCLKEQIGRGYPQPIDHPEAEEYRHLEAEAPAEEGFMDTVLCVDPGQSNI